MKPSSKIEKPEQIELLTSVIEAYTTVYITGGSLHIVLDDGNFTKASIEWCKTYATENGDLLGVAIADMLAQMPEKHLKTAEKFSLDLALLEWMQDLSNS